MLHITFQWLLGNTVVVNPKHMSNNWRPVGNPLPAKSGTNIGSIVRAGDRGYNILTNNCIHGANRMCGRSG